MKLLLAALALVASALPAGAQRRIVPDVSSASTGSPSIALNAARSCVQRIADQASGGCLQASSTPTFGLLFPYPGNGNEFTPPAFVGGGADNSAPGFFATVTGGAGNRASGYISTVGGGAGNSAANQATVAGGYGNSASGTFASVAGGLRNRASASFATIGGGSYNDATLGWATVGGGLVNNATGGYATVPGGLANTAAGAYSFAAGRRARALHTGAFVWGDGQGADKLSSSADEFNVYASGGARFFSNSAATAGVLLAPGAGSWTSVSDRAAKENLEPVDAREVLERVAALPIATWNYTSQSAEIRHMGPMAQDFHAAFGLGLGEKTIDTIDADGVALAAIQGLRAELEELRAENGELRRRLDRLENVDRPEQVAPLEKAPRSPAKRRRPSPSPR